MKDNVHPIGLKLDGRECLVVGSSAETWARAASLVQAGARVHVVSETPCTELSEAAARSAITLTVRSFLETDFDGAWLGVLADRDERLAERMAHAAARRRIFFCAVDQPAHSTFSHLAIARSGPVLIAISSSGRAPALARRLREELERLLGEVDVAGFVERLSALRQRTPSADRARVLGRAVRGVRFDGSLRIPEEPEPEAAGG